MHILLTNDDGPPNPYSSPYFASFVRTLTSPPFNHTVAVVIPSTQRSWIGKAHLLPPSFYPTSKTAQNEKVTDVLTPSYYDPDTGDISTTPPWSSSSDEKNGDAHRNKTNYWVLIPGTPATCTQLGLFHHDRLFPHLANKSSNTATSSSGPDATASRVDMVISGPNFGRNTTAAFALSSGTLGGALEASVCSLPAVAISFGFFTKQEPPELVDAACAHSLRIVEKLVRDGLIVGKGKSRGKDTADCFSINVPLVEGVQDKEVRWSWMLENKWKDGSLYKVVEDDDEGEKPAEEANLRFRWAPNFKSVLSTMENAEQGCDGVLVRDGITSVTPLKASFADLHGTQGYKGVIKL